MRKLALLLARLYAEKNLRRFSKWEMYKYWRLVHAREAYIKEAKEEVKLRKPKNPWKTPEAKFYHRKRRNRITAIRRNFPDKKIAELASGFYKEKLSKNNAKEAFEKMLRSTFDETWFYTL